jgi:ABC-type Mn2+/Zn2+ transport system permease subunit
MMVWAAVLGSISVYLGLLASYYFNLAAGASIVLVATLIFFIVFLLRSRPQAAFGSSDLG